MFKYYLPKYSDEIITKKKYKEFDIKVPVREPVPTEIGIPLSHQKMISNIMKGFTTVESLLLVHDMGTGKTCTAINAIEENLSDKTYGMKQALILNRGKSVINNFINELLTKCTTKYSRGNDNKFTKYYTFDTFELFTKNIKNKSDSYISNVYNNTFIVIDEVHNILNTESEVYIQIERFLNLIPNKKLLLLTGTPVRDVESDIVPILNLLFPRNEKIDRDTFSKLYYDNYGNLKNSFKEKILGKVSYLKSSIPEIPIEYEGKTVYNLRKFHVIPLFMKPHQEKYYLDAINKDLTYSCIYNNSRQATRFVFPNGTYGTEGFVKYVKVQNGKYSLTNEMKKDLRKYGNTIEEILKRIGELSIIYEYKIKKILEAEKNKEKTIIYDDLVKGSGLILFSLLLKEVKFTKFVLISAETTSAKQLSKIQKSFNDDVLGNNISVIIGSKVISEGFTFTDVLHEHVVPHWNNTETSQVLARGIRFGSHNKILKINPDAKVKIYREIALVSGLPSKSVDYIMTKTSEEKDININMIINAIKEASITCESFQERNGGECIIKKEGELIYDNYISQNIISNEMIRKIQNIVSEKNMIGISEISDILKIPIEEVCAYCYYIISNKLSWNIFNGIRVYMKNNNDIMYIIDDLNKYSDEYSAIYTNIIKPFNNSSLTEQYENALSIILPHRDINKNIQRLIEFALTAKLGYISTAKEKNVDEILEKYKGYWEINYTNKTAICWYLFDITKGTLNATCIENPQTSTPWLEWKICGQQLLDTIAINNYDEQDFEEKVRTKNYYHYGLVNPNTNDFCIKEIQDIISSKAVKKLKKNVEIIDKRHVTSGKRCINWNKRDLLNISENIGININQKQSRDFICSQIRNKMEDLEIIKENRFCGTQNKKK